METLYISKRSNKTGQICGSTLEVWRSIGTAMETSLHFKNTSLEFIETAATLHIKIVSLEDTVWRPDIEALHFKRHLDVIETAVEASLQVSLEVN